MENKVADGAIGMRPSATLRRPSIFKSPSLAKRAGGRRVFLSRRKITHCPLSVVLRAIPAPLAHLLCHRRSSWSTTAGPKSLFSPFGLPVYSASAARTLFRSLRRLVANERKNEVGW